MSLKISLLLLLGSVLTFSEVYGHGRLISPPSRSSAWRFGFNTPRNYNDHELNCGGITNQWQTHEGKCGLCGDPYQGPRRNEYPGGIYATGTVVAEYSSGSTIDVTVQITANHKGYHQFRLCEKNNPESALTQACLNQHLLPDAVNGNTNHTMGTANQDYTYHLRLPAGLSCSHCVLQWKYNAGNRWGTDPLTGNQDVGLGYQEQFYGCADIAITTGSGEPSTTTTTTTTTPPSQSTSTSQPSRSTTTTAAAATTTTTTTTTTRSSWNQEVGTGKCVPTEEHQDLPGITDWCNWNCFHYPPYCPAEFCICEN